MSEKEKREHIQYLLLRYLDNTSTGSEKEQLFHYLSGDNDKQQWEELMEELLLAEPAMTDYDPAKWQPVLEELRERTTQQVQTPVRRIPFLRRNKWWAAAAVLLLVAGYFAMRQSARSVTPGKDITYQQPGGTDVLPGNNKAILTLSDGKAIILDNAARGTLSREGSAKVVKLDDGRVVYMAAGDKSDKVVYNTMSTPRGGQYRLTLPDGTEVWLNAASSITYPTAFTGTDRQVSITGEAYFEVAKNTNPSTGARTPFHVKANGTTIEVLGTHFNVNAYPDESVIKTTLLEGSVKIISASSNAMLKPGQQAQVNHNGNIRLISEANTEEAMAWKNGRFYFDEADIQSIMRQVARWYDVKVVYEKEIPQGHYRGRPSRNLTLLQMLKVFEYSGLKFKIEGNTMTVID